MDPTETFWGAIKLKGFTGWVGNAFGSGTSISFSIDRPKDVMEVWEFDSTILGIVGVVSGLAVTIVK